MTWHTNNAANLLPFGSVSGSALQWNGSAWVDTVRSYNLGTTYVPHFKLQTTTPSDGTTQRQFSPVLSLGATAWINSAASQTLEMGWVCIPTVGTSMTGQLGMAYSLNGGTWTLSSITFTTSGSISATSVTATSIAANAVTTSVASLGDGDATTYTVSFRAGSGTQATSGAPIQESGAVIYRCHAWDADAAPSGVSDSHEFATKAYPNRADVNNSRARLRWGYRKGPGLSAPTASFATVCELNDVGAISPANGVCLPAFAVASLPTATATGQIIYCSDGDTGAKCLAMWDGSAWKRIVLGATVAAS